MARRSPYTARERALVLLQKHTQKEAARILGVTDRTVRRWKNEGVAPSRANDHKLTLESNRERRAIAIHNRRLAHGRQPAIARAPVMPVGERRVLKVYKNNKFTWQYRESPWVNYDVSRLTYRDVFEMLRGLRGRFLVVQFIFDANKDDPAATGRFIIDRRGKVTKIRGVSVPQDMSAVHTDAELADLVAPYYPPNPRRLLWFAIHDRTKPKRRQ